MQRCSRRSGRGRCSVMGILARVRGSGCCPRKPRGNGISHRCSSSNRVCVVQQIVTIILFVIQNKKPLSCVCHDITIAVNATRILRSARTHIAAHNIRATMMHNSMSLRPTEKIQYETLRTQFTKLHPAATPPQKVEFQPPPYCKVIDSESKQPVTVTSEVTEIVGWPSDDGSKIRFEISTPAENLNPFWKWLNATFGVDGLIADSLESNYTAMGTFLWW